MSNAPVCCPHNEPDILDHNWGNCGCSPELKRKRGALMILGFAVACCKNDGLTDEEIGTFARKFIAGVKPKEKSDGNV